MKASPTNPLILKAMREARRALATEPIVPVVTEIRKDALMHALESQAGNITQAAVALGLARSYMTK